MGGVALTGEVDDQERGAYAFVDRGDGGGRAVGLTITGVGLYIVLPSLLSIFGSWPRLRDVDPVWFVVLVQERACPRS